MRQLTMADSVFVFTEQPHGTSHHMGMAFIFDPSTADEPVTFEKLVDLYRRRLHVARSFREKLVRVPLDLDYPYWINDKNFELEFHVRHSGLPRPGTRKQFFAVVNRLMSLPLDMSRPLWETYLIEGLDQVEGIPPGSFALLLKMHHASLDGVSGMEMLSALFASDAAVEARLPGRKWRGEDVPDQRTLLLKAIGAGLKGPLKLTRALLESLPALVEQRQKERSGKLVKPPKSKVPKTRFNGPVTPHRVMEGRVWDFAAVKQLRDAVPGTTINDIVLTIVGGSLRRYLQSKHELPKESLIVVVPISIRSEEQKAADGNQVITAFIKLHTDIADPLERLAAVKASMRQVKDYNRAVDAKSLARTADAMPGLLMGVAFRALSVVSAESMLMTNTVVTNVPGTQAPLSMFGARFVAGFSSGPSQSGAGLFHGVTSMSGRLSISFNADREMMPDPEYYAQCIEDSFNELRSSLKLDSGKAARPARRPRKPNTATPRSR